MRIKYPTIVKTFQDLLDLCAFLHRFVYIYGEITIVWENDEGEHEFFIKDHTTETLTVDNGFTSYRSTPESGRDPEDAMEQAILELISIHR
jgi:hypothetical protein